MVILTVVRRLLIFVICILLLFNAVALVMAQNASMSRSPQTEAFHVRAYVASRKAAYRLARELKFEQGKYRIFDLQRTRREKTGGYRGQMRFTRAPAEQVRKIAHGIEEMGVPVKVENNPDGTRSIVTRATFLTRAQAVGKINDLFTRSQSMYKMTVVPATRRVAYKAWCVETTVADADTLQSIRERVKGKASLDVR